METEILSKEKETDNPNYPEMITTELVVSDYGIKLHSEKPSLEEINLQNLRFAIFAEYKDKRTEDRWFNEDVNAFIMGCLRRTAYINFCNIDDLRINLKNQRNGKSIVY